MNMQVPFRNSTIVFSSLDRDLNFFRIHSVTYLSIRNRLGSVYHLGNLNNLVAGDSIKALVNLLKRESTCLEVGEIYHCSNKDVPDNANDVEPSVC